MKIRFDFVTNSSSSSFVAVNIVDSELAKICKKYRIKMKVSGNSASFEHELGEVELPIAPKGTDFIQWFLNFVSEVELADETAKAEILAHKKEIQDSFVSSSIVYEYCNTEDYSRNSHWEEFRNKEKIVIKGFDTSKWDVIWGTQDWNEIAKLDKSGGDISRLSPDEYPFWLFLTEGRASGRFFQNMMDKYGTIERHPSADLSGEIGKLDTKIEKLVETLDGMSVSAEDAELALQTIAAAFDHLAGDCADVYSYKSDRYAHFDNSMLADIERRYSVEGYNIDHIIVEYEKRSAWTSFLRNLYEKAIAETGAIRRDSISRFCDYAMVLNPLKGAINKSSIKYKIGEKFNLWNGRDYDLKLLSDQEYECAEKEFIIESLERTLSEIEEANALREKRNKPAIKVIWEDQLHKYLLAHTSMGGIEPETIVGSNGTVRLPVPACYRNMMDDMVDSMNRGFPSKMVNKSTQTYVHLKDRIHKCYTCLGYPSEEAFFDAYGYTVKGIKPAVKNNVSLGEFQYEISRKKEVTIVRYNGRESRVVIPETIEGCRVKAIGVEAFAQNSFIKEVIMPDCIDTLRGKAFSSCEKLKTVRLSNSISKIVKDTFYGCIELTKINIPDSIISVSSGTFRDCPLESIHIGKALADIDRNAFRQLNIHWIPETGEYASEPAEKAALVKELTIDPDNKNFIIYGAMVLSADGKVLLAALGDEESFEIPSGVEIINDEAFKGNGFMKYVSFPESLRIIGNNAFKGSGLLTVSFPKNLTHIGVRAFYDCNNLHSVTFNDGLEKIYDEAFSETAVRQVKLPDSVNELGFKCFSIFDFMFTDYYEREHGYKASVEPTKWLNLVFRWDRIANGQEKATDSVHLDNLDTRSFIEKL